MTWLLWREYRQNRWILALGAAGILFPYLFVMQAVSETDTEAYAKYFVAYVYSYGWAWIAVALLAGRAIAGGRADRSAEFLAYLPLNRRRVLASKLILPLLTFATAVGVNTVFVDLLIRPVEPVEMTDLVDLRVLASVLLVVLGGCWLSTQFLSSTVYAASIGALLPVGFGVGVAVVLDFTGASGDASLNDALAMINVPVAILCFGLGTWIFLHRREP